MPPLRTAVIGAGVIGRTHVETLGRCEALDLAALVDPDPVARDLAEAVGVPYFCDADAMLAAGVAEAAVVAAPNTTHLPLGRRLLHAGLPVLMEKPLAGTLEECAELVALVRETGVPVLVGHHRRHDPIIKTAKAAIERGEIGDLVTATVMSVLTKPDAYFDVPWRIAPRSGGPLMINATHEIDLLRHFFGDIARATAVTSNARRGNPVEDSAAAILEFAGGGLATITQTDAGCGPWAWDVTAGENLARFPAHDTIAHAYAGTRAALSLPDLTLWRHPGPPDWTTKMSPSPLPHEPGNPYIAQLEHFSEVARGLVEPINSAEDGLATMRVVEAIRRSAAEARPVDTQTLGA